MQRIIVYINNRVASILPDEFIVADNDDWKVQFKFDSEWHQFSLKTARIFIGEEYTDQVFRNDIITLPKLPEDVGKIKIGVFANNGEDFVYSSTVVEIPVKQSALTDGGGQFVPVEPDPIQQALKLEDADTLVVNDVSEGNKVLATLKLLATFILSQDSSIIKYNDNAEVISIVQNLPPFSGYTIYKSPAEILTAIKTQNKAIFVDQNDMLYHLVGFEESPLYFTLIGWEYDFYGEYPLIKFKFLQFRPANTEGHMNGELTEISIRSSALQESIDNDILFEIGEKYTLPANGIPYADMDSTVQGLLDKANTALQTAPVSSVNNKTGAVVLDARDVNALPDNTPVVNSFNGRSGDILVTIPSTAADVGAEPAVTEVTVSTAGAVSRALDAHKLYHFTGALTALTITLNAASGVPAQYHFDFVEGSTAFDPSLPNSVVLPDNHTWEADTRYEVDILNNYAVVVGWAVV